MPCSPTSSSRPMNGMTNVAPAFAARIACAAEKHSVTFTIAPSSVSRRHARSPSGVSGTFTAMFLAMPRSTRASAIMPSNSVEATSALTGPGTVAQISASTSWNFRPGLGHQRRIGGNAIEQPAGGERLDLRGVRGIDKELHAIAPICGYAGVRQDAGRSHIGCSDSESEARRRMTAATSPPPPLAGGGRGRGAPHNRASTSGRGMLPVSRSPARSTTASRPTCTPDPGDVVLVPLNRREEFGVVWDHPLRRQRPRPQAEADHPA